MVQFSRSQRIGMKRLYTAVYTLPSHPGIKYVQVTYFKKVISVKRTVTTTVLVSTITNTTTQTSTSTSTVVPSGITTTSTFSTAIGTPTTIINTVTASSLTSQSETLVSTTTIYAAWTTNNVLGPRLENGNEFAGFDTRDPAVQTSRKQASTPYECCVAYITSPGNCQFSFYDPDNEFCFDFENAATCPA
ncbi:MAG: hypothetical protein LQ339_007772 [Xanthoria mediterranea]|nr:MAG: hypothetical protein LQ339_007772 [Xanthoria mediterranea]